MIHWPYINALFACSLRPFPSHAFTQCKGIKTFRSCSIDFTALASPRLDQSGEDPWWSSSLRCLFIQFEAALLCLHHPSSEQKQSYIYARVSSKKQEKDLERQVQLLRARYPSYPVITDIGSGINFKRSGLRTLLERSRRGLVKEIVLAHRDRLCRFAFDLLSYVFKLNDTQIIVVFSESEPSTSSLYELSEDILAINTVFICRLQGRRAAEHRKQKETSTAGTSAIDKQIGTW